MRIISTRTDIDILQTQLREKKNRFDNAIQTGALFEETKKLYLEMKELRQNLDRRLQSLNSEQDAVLYQHRLSISAS
jgi:hypothetical protein